MTLHSTLGPVGVLLFAMTAAPVVAQTVEERLKRGDDVIRDLNRGQPQPALEHTRQLAATGQSPFLEVHAGYAFNIGVSEEELKEIIYMITVPAGISRAIAASQVLSELFAERRDARRPQ